MTSNTETVGGCAGRLGLLGFLVLCCILWLLLMTCLRENWGFWQSPSVYKILTHEYPEWMRDYIRTCYHPFFAFTAFQVVVWTGLKMRSLQGRVVQLPHIISILFIWSLFGFTIGVMCANNFVTLIDRGQLHGNSHINPWMR